MSIKPTSKEIVVQTASGLLILLFLYTGSNKFFAFDHFVGQMQNQVFPQTWVPFLIYGLPSIEIIIAVLLMFNKTKMIALWASLVLMSLFTIYTALVLFNFFGRVPCSCGGVIEQLSWGQHLIFNLVFVFIAITGIFFWKESNKSVARQAILS
jgi:Methylamine utilisation protein MauE.